MLFGISEKKLMGCFLGSCNSLRDIPRMIAMWRAGQLDLEALVTARRPLDEINEAFTDLAAGVGIRTVIDLREQCRPDPGRAYTSQSQRQVQSPRGMGESPDRRWPGGTPLVIIGGITTGSPRAHGSQPWVDPVRSRGRR